jgi:hypothetical protein
MLDFFIIIQDKRREEYSQFPQKRDNFMVLYAFQSLALGNGRF